jgi:transposase
MESVPPMSRTRRARRVFSVADKLRILKEAEACTERGQLGALLRREGIYTSHLSAWRKEMRLHGTAGLDPKKPGRKPLRDEKDKRIAELEKKASRLESKLSLAYKLLELQKKASEILGVTLPSGSDD